MGDIEGWCGDINITSVTHDSLISSASLSAVLSRPEWRQGVAFKRGGTLECLWEEEGCGAPLPPSRPHPHFLEPLSGFQEQLRRQLLHSPLPYRGEVMPGGHQDTAPPTAQHHISCPQDKAQTVPQGLVTILLQDAVDVPGRHGQALPKITMTRPTPSPKHSSMRGESRQLAWIWLCSDADHLEWQSSDSRDITILQWMGGDLQCICLIVPPCGYILRKPFGLLLSGGKWMDYSCSHFKTVTQLMFFFFFSSNVTHFSSDSFFSVFSLGASPSMSPMELQILRSPMQQLLQQSALNYILNPSES